MSDAETSAYLLIAGGLTWVLVGIVGLVRRRRGREGNDLEQTLEDRGRAEGEEVDASEECLGELVDLLNSDHPLMRPHVDGIVDSYLVKELKSGKNWQRRFSTAQSRRSAAPGYTPGLIREAGLHHGATEFWAWGIDTGIPMRTHQTQGRGTDRADCMRQFKAAWERFAADPANLTMVSGREEEAAPMIERPLPRTEPILHD